MVTLSLTLTAAAAALTKAANNARAAYLGEVKAYIMQVRPAAGESVFNARTLAGAFELRVVLHGAGGWKQNPGKVWILDNAKLAKGIAKLAAIDPDALARIAAGKGLRLDCDLFLQLCVFGYDMIPA